MGPFPRNKEALNKALLRDNGGELRNKALPGGGHWGGGNLRFP